jgi:hypothetical protein
MTRYDVVVIGAGPAGLFCAIHAAVPGSRILILEKMAKPGTKLLLAGSGQCNITHDGESHSFLARYGNHGKFLKPALFGFTNKDLVDFFSSRKILMESREDGKIFPVSRKSADILEILLDECAKKKVEIRCVEPVISVGRENDKFCITTTKTTYQSRYLVLSTGGLSYPHTGSSGDGYHLARALGQPVTDTGPALTPLIIKDFRFKGLAGLSFMAMEFSHWRSGKKVTDHTGDILFTHHGISGPGILDSSRFILPGDIIKLNFTPLNRDKFTLDFEEKLRHQGAKQVKSVLQSYPVPERLVKALLEAADVPRDLTCSHLTGSVRNNLVQSFTEHPFIVERPGDYSIAMATRGGIDLEQVNSKTLESKLIPNLFFAGEILDIDGDTGGYNLQAAFSTGSLAGSSIRNCLAR